MKAISTKLKASIPLFSLTTNVCFTPMNKSHEAIATLKYEFFEENSKEFKVHNLTISLAKFTFFSHLGTSLFHMFNVDLKRGNLK